MKFSRIQSAQLSGLHATRVVVETDISRGLYMFQIVGLPDKAVEESRERVISALRNALDINPKTENHKVIVSLSPAEVKKEGSYFDIAIALGYSIATEKIEMTDEAHEQFQKIVSHSLFLGELALNGDVRPIRGLLAIAQWAKSNDIQTLFIPEENKTEASLIDGLTFYLIPTLAALVSHLKGETRLSVSLFVPHTYENKKGEELISSDIDFGDVRGQAQAKRALTIAAAGGHNVVLYGPPGTGKTMLARAFHGILPPLTEKEFLEVATIYSSIGLVDDVLQTHIPLRSPHHSASHVAIIGGGSHIRPGDITLAHRGILYMDEFPEFDRRVLEALREPLEDGTITVARARGSVRFPARFILLAAMNPCPCGYRGSAIKNCTCTGSELARYNRKISGPIIDRIDLWVPVRHIDYETLHATRTENESPRIRTIVSHVRDIQYKRNNSLNSALSTNAVQSKSLISEHAKSQLQLFAERLKLSPRSYLRIIKVARTIADLDNCETIEESHILEALQYRPKFE